MKNLEMRNIVIEREEENQIVHYVEIVRCKRCYFFRVKAFESTDYSKVLEKFYEIRDKVAAREKDYRDVISYSIKHK